MDPQLCVQPDDSLFSLGKNCQTSAVAADSGYAAGHNGADRAVAWRHAQFSDLGLLARHWVVPASALRRPNEELVIKLAAAESGSLPQLYSSFNTINVPVCDARLDLVCAAKSGLVTRIYYKTVRDYDMNRNLRILLLTILFLVLLLGLYQLIQPEPLLGKLSLYNVLFNGRERLPFGENAAQAYNFSLNNLDAMIRSHKIAASRSGQTAGEKRHSLKVVLIGDSSTWGTLLRPEETLAGILNGKTISYNGETLQLETYNLGYPTLSLAKDLLILERSLAYEPDVILWLTTLEAFPADKQMVSPLAAANLSKLNRLLSAVNISADWLTAKPPATWQAGTLFAQRRALLDLIRLQLYGVMWSASGIDQEYPNTYPAPQLDFEPDNTFHGVEGAYPNDQLAWELLTAGKRLIGDTKLIIVNEPILISSGINSDIRYNFYYPRQAYDAWRNSAQAYCAKKGLGWMDFWDILPENTFTNSAIHYNFIGAQTLAEELLNQLPEMLQN